MSMDTLSRRRAPQYKINTYRRALGYRESLVVPNQADTNPTNVFSERLTCSAEIRCVAFVLDSLPLELRTASNSLQARRSVACGRE